MPGFRTYAAAQWARVARIGGKSGRRAIGRSVERATEWPPPGVCRGAGVRRAIDSVAAITSGLQSNRFGVASDHLRSAPRSLQGTSLSRNSNSRRTRGLQENRRTGSAASRSGPAAESAQAADAGTTLDDIARGDRSPARTVSTHRTKPSAAAAAPEMTTAPWNRIAVGIRVATRYAAAERIRGQPSGCTPSASPRLCSSL
jgi:hypothetical protein